MLGNVSHNTPRRLWCGARRSERPKVSWVLRAMEEVNVRGPNGSLNPKLQWTSKVLFKRWGAACMCALVMMCSFMRVRTCSVQRSGRMLPNISDGPSIRFKPQSNASAKPGNCSVLNVFWCYFHSASWSGLQTAVFLLRGLTVTHIPARAVFNNTHEVSRKNNINQYPPLKVNWQKFTLIESALPIVH